MFYDAVQNVLACTRIIESNNVGYRLLNFTGVKKSGIIATIFDPIRL